MLILFRDVPLRYGDSTEDQIGSSTGECIGLGQRQTRNTQPTTWCANEDAEAQVSCWYGVDPAQEHAARLRAHASVHDLGNREFGKCVVRVNLRMDGG